jgi:hypothetical protein
LERAATIAGGLVHQKPLPIWSHFVKVKVASDTRDYEKILRTIDLYPSCLQLQTGRPNETGSTCMA